VPDESDSWDRPDLWDHHDNGRGLCGACWDDWPCHYAPTTVLEAEEAERAFKACPMTHLPEMACATCGKPVETSAEGETR
jgi:hypothetical protein